ncbi:hypothetical protein [Thermotoga profunda]|uniref:hypothetical protein n=1 Tax=Thermotoga profunda TaxID=1508420 RepID=UPI000597C392|nr:hypothetical protein [Thermotoga profunda]
MTHGRFFGTYFVLICLTLIFSADQILAATIGQDQIIRVIKEFTFGKDIPDQAYKMALDSLKDTKTLRKLIEMTVKVDGFEKLCNTPVPNDFNNVNEFRAFKKLIKDKLNPLNWLVDLVTPKWVSFINDAKEVFSAARIDILERALKESQYQNYKTNRDRGDDMITAYDMSASTKGFYIIRSSEQYKNLSDSQVHEMLRTGMEERYQAEKYAQFIMELKANRQKYIKDILRNYNEYISDLVEKAKEFAQKTMINLTGTWVVQDSAGRFNGTMTLNHIDYTTAIGTMQTPGGIINTDAYIHENQIELRFHFYSFNVIDQYLHYPELSQHLVSKGGVLATVILEITGNGDYYSGTLYPWFVRYNDSEGLVVKEIVYGTVGESGTPRSITISRQGR